MDMLFKIIDKMSNNSTTLESRKIHKFALSLRIFSVSTFRKQYKQTIKIMRFHTEIAEKNYEISYIFC